MRTLRAILTVAAALTLGASAARADEGFTVHRAGLNEAGDRIEVEGEVDVPSGIVIQLAVKFAGQVGPVAKTEVIGKKFSLAIPIEGEIVPGTYTLQLALAAAQPRRLVKRLDPALRKALTEPHPREIELGDAELGEEIIKASKSKLADVMKGTREAFEGLVRFEAAPVDVVKKEWPRAQSLLWNDQLRNLRADWDRYKGTLFMAPFPEAIAYYDALTVVLDKWYQVFSTAIAKRAGLAPPGGGAAGRAANPGVLFTQVRQQAAAVYKAFGAEVEAWGGDLVVASGGGDATPPAGGGGGAAPSGPADPSGPAEPKVGRITPDGRNYVSYVAKLRVALPSARWGFDFEKRPHPTTQFRMVPKDGAKAVIVVEIAEVRGATSVDELVAHARASAAERFSNLKEIASSEVAPTDPSMPDKTRPGIDLTFTTQAKDDAPTFWIRTRHLFGRGHDRIYRVICIAPAGTEGPFEAEFADAVKSLTILDHPRFQRAEAAERAAKGERRGGPAEPRGKEKPDGSDGD